MEITRMEGGCVRGTLGDQWGGRGCLLRMSVKMSMNAAARRRLFCLLIAEGVEHLTKGWVLASCPGDRSLFG